MWLTLFLKSLRHLSCTVSHCASSCLLRWGKGHIFPAQASPLRYAWQCLTTFLFFWKNHCPLCFQGGKVPGIWG